MRGFRPFAMLGDSSRRHRREPTLDASPAPECDIDADWLDQHVFCMLPELVGAAYDRRIANAEVAAVLARMCGESKLASRVAAGSEGWNNLELWLLVEQRQLSGYERELIDSLFFAGKTTSADLIQHEYARAGFEPAAILRSHLRKACNTALGIRRRWPFGLARESADGLALRQNLRTARRFFAAELERPEPRLRDEWLPYLIALELSAEVTHWHQAFGRIDTAALAQRAGSNDPAAQRWTGGAGALGGIGASGPWLAATARLTFPPARERRASGDALGRRLQLEHA